MKNFIKANKILLSFVLIAIIVATTVIGTRFGIESNNKSYDVVIDYNEIEAMAKQSDKDVSMWLKEFKDMGITKVGLQEENIMTLMENSWIPVTGKVMSLLTQEANWQEDYPAEFIVALNEHGWDEFDVLIEAEGSDTIDLIGNGIKERFQPEKYFMCNIDNKMYAVLDGTSDTTLYNEKYKYMNSKNAGFVERMDVVGSKLMYISLGLMPSKVSEIQNLGMDVIPRTLSYSGWNDTKFAKAVVAGYERYGITPEYMIVGGEAVIGYDDGADFAKHYILDNGITIGLIENTTQLQNIMQYGVQDVAIESGYDTVRVFSVWNYIQYRYQYYGYKGAKEIENTLFRAVTERNVRVIYFKPFLENKNWHTYVTNVDDYKEMFSNLETRLEKHGFEFGSASVMEEHHVNRLTQMLIGIGCALGAVILLKSILPIKKKGTIILSVLGVLAVIGAYFVMPNTAVLITSFAAAVVFACLALTFFTFRSRQFQETLNVDSKVIPIVKAAAGTLIVSVLIALCGGLMTAAPICSTDYMLEINIFRGVKISQLLPIAYFIVAFLAYYGYGERKKSIGHLELHDIKDLLSVEIKIWMILVLAVIGGVGMYYIMRTGHDSSVDVSSVEMLFRNKLEETLLARPRNKEFLFAFPAIMVMVYCAVRRLKLFTLLFGLCGVIGVTSVVNTFMHIRTPLYLGIVRTGYSLLFGLVIGVVAILIFDGLYRLYNRYFRKYIDAACME